MSDKYSDIRDAQETQLLDSCEKSGNGFMAVSDIYDAGVQLPTSDYPENISSDIQVPKDGDCTIENVNSDNEIIISNMQEKKKHFQHSDGTNDDIDNNGNVLGNDNPDHNWKHVDFKSPVNKRDNADINDTGDFSGFGETPFKNLNNLFDSNREKIIESPWLKNVKNPFDLNSPYKSHENSLNQKSQANAHEIFSRLRKDQSLSQIINSQKPENGEAAEPNTSIFDIEEEDNTQEINFDKSDILFRRKNSIGMNHVGTLLNESEDQHNGDKETKACIRVDTGILKSNETFKKIESLDSKILNNAKRTADFQSAGILANTVEPANAKILGSISQNDHTENLFGISDTQKLTQKGSGTTYSNSDNLHAGVIGEFVSNSQEPIKKIIPNATYSPNNIEVQVTQKAEDTFSNSSTNKIEETQICSDTSINQNKYFEIREGHGARNSYEIRSSNEIEDSLDFSNNKMKKLSSDNIDSSRNDIQIAGTLDIADQNNSILPATKIETLDVGATPPDQDFLNGANSLSLLQRIHHSSPPESPVIEQSSPAVRESIDIIDLTRLSQSKSFKQITPKSDSIFDNTYQVVTSSPTKRKVTENIKVSEKNNVEIDSSSDSGIPNTEGILATDEVNDSLRRYSRKPKLIADDNGDAGTENSGDKMLNNTEESRNVKQRTESEKSKDSNDLFRSKSLREHSNYFKTNNDDITKQENNTLRKDSILFKESDIGDFTSVWALYDIRIYPARITSMSNKRYNAQFYDGSLIINSKDILGPLDIMVGDSVKIHGKKESYIVTGLTRSEDHDDKFKCIRGYDKVLLKRSVRHTINERYPEIQVSLWDIYIPSDIWSERRRPSKTNDSFLEKLEKMLEDDNISEIFSSQDFTTGYSYVSPEISPTKIKIKSSIFKNAVFCLTGESEEDRRKITTMIVENGGKVLINGLSHLFSISKDSNGNISSLDITKQYKNVSFVAVITTQFSRSQKYLQCLALGWPTLSTSFIFDCIKYNKWLDYWLGYRLPAGESKMVKSIQGSNISNFCSNFQRNSTINSQLQNNRHVFEGSHIILINKKPSICEFLFHILGAETLTYIGGYSKEIFSKAREIQSKNRNANIILYDQKDVNQIYGKLMGITNTKAMNHRTSKKRAASGRLITQSSKRKKVSTRSNTFHKASKKEINNEIFELQLCDWEWVVQCIISAVFWPTEKRFLIHEDV